MKKFFKILFLILIISSPAFGDDFQDDTIIRDSEIEETLKSYISPLFKVAGLSPETLKIHLIVNKQVNAMASIGYQLFLFTGFLLEAKNVGQVIGVLAHETGHIADGHIERMIGHGEKMMAISVAHLLLGAAAAVAGSPEAGVAIGMGGVGVAQNEFLHYHRGQEAAADQDALRYLDKLGWSAKGLDEFLTILLKQEYLSSSRQDPYLRTHPLTRERVETVKRYLQLSKFTNAPFPKGFERKFQLMQAKLLSFLYPAKALGVYDAADTSVAARYARAIAYYRLQDLTKSLDLLDELIKEEPHNPYFWELKAQILFENGKIQECLSTYEKAVHLAPHASLIKIQYAHALIEANDPTNFTKAETLLNAAYSKESENTLLWHLLAILYGRRQEEGLMCLALAEEGFLRGDPKVAKYQANRAIQKLKKNSVHWIRAQDLLSQVKQEENEK